LLVLKRKVAYQSNKSGISIQPAIPFYSASPSYRVTLPQHWSLGTLQKLMRLGTKKIPFSEVSHIDCKSMAFVSGLREDSENDRKFHSAKNKIIDQIEHSNHSNTVVSSTDIVKNIENISFRCDKPACKMCVLQIIQTNIEVLKYFTA
jgi:hypothetical protein